MRTREEALRDLDENGRFINQVASETAESIVSARPGEDKWSVKEIIGHLSDIQNVCAGRVRLVAREDEPAIELYDEEKENRERDHSRDDLKTLVSQFAAERADMRRTLEALDADGWQRSGHHPIVERFTIHYVVNDMLDHEQKHFDQIRQLLGQARDE